MTSKNWLGFLIVVAHSGLQAQVPPIPPPPPPLTETQALNAGVNTVIVSGTASISLTPDFVSFSVGVETTGPAIAATVKENNTKVTKILNALRGLGVKQSEIQTSTFRLHSVFKKEEKIGYRVSNRISVSRRDVSRVGDLLEAAIAAGANEVDGPNFSIGDEKPYQNKGFALAFEDAKSKATNLAALAGRKLGPVQGMTDGSSSPFVIKSYYGVPGGIAGGVMGDFGGVIESGSHSIFFGVTVAFKLE